MIQMSWFAHFSACWSSYTCVYDTEPLVPSLTKSSCSDSCSSASTMVKQRRTKRCHSRPSNQLLKQVSPFEELPMTDERYPVDVKDRYDVTQDRRRVVPDTRDARGDDDGIPKYVLIQKQADDQSEITFDEAVFEGERSLTPHPSFDCFRISLSLRCFTPG